MSHRDLKQLTKLKLLFCDWGGKDLFINIIILGSSRGVREVMKSNGFYDFINNNKSVQFNILLKRGGHPFMRAIYANGYKRDISLRNKTTEECLEELNTSTNLCIKILFNL
jgi:Mitochondrial ribosomal protein L51 / S25 / CI-B8 domain